MPVIKRLAENLINQIAAGEVVERPASVVKELLENSLDAGAKRITIEIENSGESLIRITDDGRGMDKEDALLCFERHATSKISSSEDLFNINTLGFRGEAIASIASVSYMTMQTKKTGDAAGTLVMCEGGKIKKAAPVGVPEGTQIEVKQLFYNTPARRKYLKNEATEYGHILSTVTGIALSFPAVAFKMVHDNKLVFEVPEAQDDLSRIRALLGRNISDELIPVFYGHSKIQLKGYIGKPIIARANRNSQYFFINNREVKSHVLSYAVKQSFHSLLPKEKQPVFLLYFNIDPAAVDVNVHPRKLEVRFADEKEIFKALLQACEKSLEKYVLAPKVSDDAPANYYEERQHKSLEAESADTYSLKNAVTVAATAAAANAAKSAYAAAEPVTVTEQLTQSSADFFPISKFEDEEQEAEQAESAPTPTAFAPTAAVKKSDQPEITTLAQLDNCYILCSQGKDLIIVDQHAAHERIRYTEIINQFEAREKATQPLLLPIQLEMSHADIAILENNLGLLSGMGFEIEPFGGNTFSVNAVPSFIVKEDIEKVVFGLIDDLRDNASKGDFQQRKEKALRYMACRSAVKFGDPLSTQEQHALIKKLQQIDQPYTCPHGRPTMINMSSDELLKRFGRKYI